MMSNLSYKHLKAIAKIIATTEREVSTEFKNSTLEKPIKNDLILAQRNMAYNEIKMQIKKFKQEKENDENE